MEGLGLQGLVLIGAGCLLVGLGLGYLISHLLGGNKEKAVAEQAEAHAAYRDEVHEHFEHTSQIMSRMVDDYREMYKHMSEGAGKLANIYPEKVITPPPAPEAITDTSADQPADEDTSAQSDTAAQAEADDPAVSGQAQSKDPQPAAEPSDADVAELQQTTADSDDTNASATAAAASETDKQRARRLSAESTPPPHQRRKSGGI